MLNHWLEGYRAFWEARFAQLDHLLSTFKSKKNEA